MALFLGFEDLSVQRHVIAAQNGGRNVCRVRGVAVRRGRILLFLGGKCALGDRENGKRHHHRQTKTHALPPNRGETLTHMRNPLRLANTRINGDRALDKTEPTDQGFMLDKYWRNLVSRPLPTRAYP